MTTDNCVVNPPPLRPGQQIAGGTFFRNLEPKHAKQFKHDEPHPPLHGWRLRPHTWGWKVQGNDGLSVNLGECIGCMLCSIMAHPKPSLFRHVVRVDLESFSLLVNRKIVAEYSPTPAEPGVAGNACHFDLLNTSGSIDDVIQQLKGIDTELMDFEANGPGIGLRALYMATFDVCFDVYPAPNEAKLTPPEATLPL